MRILGLDIGERRIGVALSDSLGLTAQGLTVLHRRTLTADMDAVGALVARHEVSCVVVGLPLTLRGEIGPRAKAVKGFVAALGRMVRVPIDVVDERFTTAQGERVLLEANVSRRRRKQVIDQLAAQLILQQYLDRKRPSVE